jgi:predicted kinase
MRVTVLRGISGSGKSTWAKQQGVPVFSTDQFFMIDGEYRYDATRIGEYHSRNLRAFLEALWRSEPWIIVDNTNICAWEYSPYVLAGQAFGYETELVTFLCSPETSLARKALIPAEQLFRISEQLVEETRNMPRRFRNMHRTIITDERLKDG